MCYFSSDFFLVLPCFQLHEFNFYLVKVLIGDILVKLLRLCIFNANKEAQLALLTGYGFVDDSWQRLILINIQYIYVHNKLYRNRHWICGENGVGSPLYIHWVRGPRQHEMSLISHVGSVPITVWSKNVRLLWPRWPR